MDPTASLRRLYGDGLIRRLEGFVWASHAAVVAEEISMSRERHAAWMERGALSINQSRGGVGYIEA
jgi:hypothetical protein